MKIKLLFFVFLWALALNGFAYGAETHDYSWTKPMGGTSADYGKSVTLDTDGNIYVTGYFLGTADFDPSSGTDEHTPAGVYDVFVTKTGSDGSYAWTKTMGGTNNDYGRSVAVDRSGNIYITGYFKETADFDPSSGTDEHTSAGQEDIFLTKLTSDGSYAWTKTMGAATSDKGFAVAVDGSGDVYVTGFFRGTVDFDPSSGTDEHTSAGIYDVFLTKLGSDGTYAWTKTMGGTDSEEGRAIALDGSGNLYLTGEFQGTADFDPSSGTDEHTSAGVWDIFLTKISTDGTYGWTKTVGGTAADYGYSVKVDRSGNVYVTGGFRDTVDFDPSSGTDEHTSPGIGDDIYLTKLSTDGTYAWTKTMGGTDEQHGYSVAVDAYGNVYVTGRFRGTPDFDPSSGTDEQTSAGVWDIFLTRINSDGSYGWTKTAGGTGNDEGFSVTVDRSVNVYVAGDFSNTADFDPSTGTDEHTSAGSTDVFLTKFESNVPTANVSTDSPSYTTGDTLTLYVRVSNYGVETTVDAYVAVMLPDGSLYFVDYDMSDGSYAFYSGTTDAGTWTPCVTGLTLPEGYSLAGYSLLEYTFTGGEPDGSYSWYIVLTDTGTTDLIGDIGSRGFTFAP